MSQVRGSSIVIENSLIDTHEHPAVRLEEIPLAVEVRGCNLYDATSADGQMTLFNLNTSINLDGPMLELAVQSGRCKYLIGANNWDSSHFRDLPQQLWPMVVGRLAASAAPTKGLWATGSIVWADNMSAAGGANGWECVRGGRPGQWQNFTFGRQGV